jgi:Fur family transcriptional regulator, iron response regulator
MDRLRPAAAARKESSMEAPNHPIVRTCPASPVGRAISERLGAAGLRLTRQRTALAGLLFGNGHRHVTADVLHAEAKAIGEEVALATVYNVLRQFTEAGLLRELAVEPGRSHFDTNTSNHNHYFIESKGLLLDIPDEEIYIAGLPDAPEGMRIGAIDVIVRLVEA